MWIQVVFYTSKHLEDWLVQNCAIRRSVASAASPILFHHGFEEPDMLYNAPRRVFERCGIGTPTAILLSNRLSNTVPIVNSEGRTKPIEAPLDRDEEIVRYVKACTEHLRDEDKWKTKQVSETWNPSNQTMAI